MGNKRILKELGEQEFVYPRASEIMESLAIQLAKANTVGVTINGPYMTLRWGPKKQMLSVSFQVLSITDFSVEDPPDNEDK